MKNHTYRSIAKTLILIAGFHAGSAFAQETTNGLTILDPGNNMYVKSYPKELQPFKAHKSKSVEVKKAEPKPVKFEKKIDPKMPEVDVQSYKVAPVPQFLIEEAMQDKGESRVKVTSASPEMAKMTSQQLDSMGKVDDNKIQDEVELNMSEGETDDLKKAKKVVPFVTRPHLWYGGPWRRG